MQLGVTFPQTEIGADPGAVRAYAQAVEEMGFDYLLAYDHVMTFKDKFENHILPDKIHILNVAFNIDSLEVDLGGTAGNIAYSLALLDERPIIHATAGSDFDQYQKKLKALELSTDSIKILDDVKTAQAFITTDLSDNQITAFHGGAMYRANEYPLDLSEKSLVIVAPNGIEAMVDHAVFCQQNNMPFIFDPGQAFNALTAEQLLGMCKGSKAMVVNDYEWQLWQDKTGLDEKKTLEITDTIVVTLGEKGSKVITKEKTVELPAVANLNVVDPTGCGDAYRAGLLYGLSREWDWNKCVQLGTVVASFSVEVQGPQNHNFSIDELKKRYNETWNEAVQL